MSFTSSLTGTTFEAGFFVVDDEACLRETTTVSADHAQKVVRNNRTIVPAGAIVPANDATAKGILYEDIDVTDGDMPGSIVTRGVVYGDRLPATIESAAANVLTGIKAIASAPMVNRPIAFANLKELKVTSVAGSASGKTTVTVKGFKLHANEYFVYKVADAKTKVKAGEDVSAWTTWDGAADITAATGKVITFAVKNADGKALAAGNATVTAKA